MQASEGRGQTLVVTRQAMEATDTGKLAYRLHSWDNTRHADDWTAVRLCREGVILRCVMGRM
jgi:hypothetical protein